MKNKICVVTGATSGIGAATALELARQGARVLLVGRNRARCASSVARIRRQTGNASVEFRVANLASMAEVRRLAEELRQTCPRVDVLVNNAGGYFLGPRKITLEGYELTFALNHLAYFLLTHLLLEPLQASPSARVVNLASQAHEKGAIDFQDLEGLLGYDGFKAYAQSKLANVLFTYELARQLAGTKVTANAVHPGSVATHFGKNNGWLRFWIRRLLKRSELTAAQGAETVVYLASAPEVEGVTGKYFVNKRAVESSPSSHDPDLAQRLWQVSREMIGLTVAMKD